MMKYRSILSLLAAAAAGATACKTEPASSSAQEKASEPAAGQLAGVWPQSFECGSIASPAALGQLLGGAVRQTDNPMTMPKGVAKPCVYELLRDNTLEQWQFDFDCRESYKTTFDKLVEQYRQQNLEMIAEWDHRADAGLFKPNDAGIEYIRPGEPTEVTVGKKALDHRGVALIFLDDDAPCYVRIAGKDAARRLELAKLVARNLTYQNAPMTPRPHAK